MSDTSIDPAQWCGHDELARECAKCLTARLASLSAELEKERERTKVAERNGIARAIARVKEIRGTTHASIVTELRRLAGESLEDICRNPGMD